MPLPSTSIPSSDRVRRRRVTTACTTCRERRIKCNRTRPVCSQCTKGGRRCKYVDQDMPQFEFVNQPQHTRLESEENASSPSGTWGSVINNQADLIKRAGDGKDEVPVWAVAEAEEPSRSQSLQMHDSATQPYVMPMSALGEKFVSALINDFPCRETCQSFFKSFLLGVHPIVPVCHEPTLRQHFEDFWATVSPSYAIESLTLILAMLYTGAVNASDVDILNSSKILHLYEEIFGLIDFASYHARNIPTSIQLLQGCLIMSTYQASHLAPFSAFGFLPQAIRFAQSLRLHAEKKQGYSIATEVQRRIWWHLVFLDIESTIATGLPTIIHRTGYTTQLPTLHHDSAITAFDNLAPILSNSCPMEIAIQGHYEWAHRMQTWFSSLPSKAEVANFKSQIEKFVDLLPDRKHPENEWARVYLKMQVDRAYCMLGLRFWQLDQYKGTGCHSEVVQTARSFLTHYLQLSTFPEMTHFSWFTPGLIQPLHAIIILLMHLSACPNISEEEQSRHLLDQVMGLRVTRIMSGTVVPTKALLRGDCHPQRANPRYLIMVELRKRVWRNIGWDSDGKGSDPWLGKIVQEVVGGGDYEEAVPDRNLEVGYRHHNGTWLEGTNANCPTNDDTGLEGLDNILAGDPMDLLQWDEWESLTAELFAS